MVGGVVHQPGWMLLVMCLLISLPLTDRLPR